MKTVTLPGGEQVPMLGQGTWMMGERPDRRAEEMAALELGADLGMTLIDTAEMYGDGAAEELIGEALGHRRDDLFLVSKAYPHHASRSALPRACEASLARLGTDRLDLYLLHWRGSVPLEETVEAMQALKQAGKIRHWGVSNLHTDDMEELVEAGGAACATDQILYNLTRRRPEQALMPWLARHQIPVMAYSPVEQGRLIDHPQLAVTASRMGASPAQVALAWAMRSGDVIAIPKAGSPAHVRDNRAAADLVIPDDELAALDAAFPVPAQPVPLEML
ncbi:aldo/keto reductase [Sphingomonas astaxanthinifaciens]|uniref:Aldo/keto reductase n=1 Tax=Sphingomonas astaxanthinifaciens DSM 22298 TaxID=1123267 RepID=A0ABQ5Z328_9SPHN|nr:aldo/keto reductase [Sphingomonas astaxanthinifaciens]GLR46431.1 aldo/keto reductase [Sphingomonas astaxanthinifaciens DSM 22298]